MNCTSRAEGQLEPNRRAMVDEEGKVCVRGVGDYEAEVSVAICICRH